MKQGLGLGRCSARESAGCSVRQAGLDPQYLHGSSQPSGTPLASSGIRHLHGTPTYMQGECSHVENKIIKYNPMMIIRKVKQGQRVAHTIIPASERPRQEDH